MAVSVDQQPAVAGAVPACEPCADPWNEWRDVKWTVYRGVAYRLDEFLPAHPGGAILAALAIGRDCTALVESYHLRSEIAEARIRSLPVLKGFPVDAVPQAPRPNDSTVYTAIRSRVRKEVFAGGEARKAHRKGGEFAIASVLGCAVAAYTAFILQPSWLTGALLGLAGSWIGTGVQHAANHGALTASSLANALLGLTSDLIGGSSLVWRYHHQVSHHIHTNDEHLDEDVVSMHPLIRYDKRLPRYAHHFYQHLFVLPSLLMMIVAWQYGDIKALLVNRSVGCTMHGATRLERVSVLAGKLAHYALIIVAPIALNGWAAGGAAVLGYYAVASIMLGCMFLVSHNVPEISKARSGMPADLDERDWGVQQIVQSASWGGELGCFFTGGLNLQVEHHLFPSVSSTHYPAIARVVRDECAKRGIPYISYSSLATIVPAFLAFMREVGAAEQEPSSSTAAMVARI